MAFNKPDMSNNVVGFGGSVTQMAANATRRRRGGGRSRRPYWANSFRLNELVPDYIRLIPGDFTTLRVDDNGQLYEEKTPWVEYLEHFHGTHKKGGICSAGPHVFGDRNKRQPCHGCDIYWESWEERKASGKKGRGPISMSNRYSLIVVDMGLFHKVPQVDANSGHYRMNPNTNEPYMTWEKCKGVGCMACQTAQESKKGYIQPWPMSKAHFNALQGYAHSIGTCCTTCRGRGVISTMSWHCGNPNCGDVIFDMTNTTATIEQITEVVNKPYFCRTCNATMYPVEQIRCANCEVQGTRPQRATIFDVDMQVKAVRTGEGEQTNLTVLATSDPKPLDQEFQDLLQYAPNLEKLYVPTPLEEQARLWHRHAAPQAQQPAQPAQPQQYAQAYAQQQPPLAGQPVAAQPPYQPPAGPGFGQGHQQ